MDDFYNLETGIAASDSGPDDGWATDSSGGGGADDLVLPGFLWANDGVYHPIEDPNDTPAERERNLVPHFAAAVLSADSAGMEYATELLGLPACLEQHRRDATTRQTRAQAESLQDTFLASDDVAGSSLDSPPSQEESPFILPPENSHRVAVEFRTVVHMLLTSAVWLECVALSTISPANQERLFDLSRMVLQAVARFPQAQEQLVAIHSSPPFAGAEGGATPSGSAGPSEGPATLNEASLSSNQRRRPQRRPRRR